MKNTVLTSTRLFLLSFLAGASAFITPNMDSAAGTRTELSAEATSRRSFVGASAATAFSFITASSAKAETETRQGIEVTPFNGLIFNYRNSQFGGLDAESIDEPSVSYREFCDRLKKGEVEFVEFMAPDGDVAYATFRGTTEGSKSAPIRIGEGFPVEQHDGWYVVCVVCNANLSLLRCHYLLGSVTAC